MGIVLKSVAVFFVYAVAAIFAQNAVFTRGLGVSRLIKLVNDETVDTLIFGVLLCAIQLISTPLSYYANILMAPLGAYRAYVRPLAFVLCSTIAFFIVLLILALFSKRSALKGVVSVLPMAAFNCCVLGTMLIVTTQNLDLLQSMGFAVGSSVGYVMACLAVTEGQRKLQSRGVPPSFRGLPATLLYIGILALAIYGFTGHLMPI